MSFWINEKSDKTYILSLFIGKRNSNEIFWWDYKFLFFLNEKIKTIIVQRKKNVILIIGISLKKYKKEISEIKPNNNNTSRINNKPKEIYNNETIQNNKKFLWLIIGLSVKSYDNNYFFIFLDVK